MGFDRLVAMASEVDKRRKSSENSPAHNSPRYSGNIMPKTMLVASRGECPPGNNESAGGKGGEGKGGKLHQKWVKMS